MPTEANQLTIEQEIFQFRNGIQSPKPKLEALTDRLGMLRPTSVDAERIFSTCRQVLTFNRTRLSPEKLSTIIFLNKNIK